MSALEKHFGRYRGIVTDNADPSGQGRVRLRMAGLLNDIETGWAMLSLPVGVSVSRIQPPNVGDLVWVEFESGDLEYPICVGKIPKH